MKRTTLLAVAAKIEGLFNTPNIFIFMRPHIGRENWHVWLGKVRIHSQMIGLESLLYFNLHFIFVQRRGFKNDFIPSALHPTGCRSSSNPCQDFRSGSVHSSHWFWHSSHWSALHPMGCRSPLDGRKFYKKPCLSKYAMK